MVRTDPPDVLLLDQRLELTLVDLCEACGLHAERLIEMVEAGVLEPRGTAPAVWRFDVVALERARITVHLQRDLGVDLAGAALALDLLEEVRTLRRRVQLLEHQLFDPL